jgi:hypothetical protein
MMGFLSSQAMLNAAKPRKRAMALKESGRGTKAFMVGGLGRFWNDDEVWNDDEGNY